MMDMTTFILASGLQLSMIGYMLWLNKDAQEFNKQMYDERVKELHERQEAKLKELYLRIRILEEHKPIEWDEPEEPSPKVEAYRRDMLTAKKWATRTPVETEDFVKGWK